MSGSKIKTRIYKDAAVQTELLGNQIEGKQNSSVENESESPKTQNPLVEKESESSNTFINLAMILM